MKKLVKESLYDNIHKTRVVVKLPNDKVVTIPDINVDPYDRYKIVRYLVLMGYPEKLANSYKLFTESTENKSEA